MYPRHSSSSTTASLIPVALSLHSPSLLSFLPPTAHSLLNSPNEAFNIQIRSCSSSAPDVPVASHEQMPALHSVSQSPTLCGSCLSLSDCISYRFLHYPLYSTHTLKSPTRCSFCLSQVWFSL